MEQLASLIKGAGWLRPESEREVGRAGATTTSNRPPTSVPERRGTRYNSTADITLDDDPMAAARRVHAARVGRRPAHRRPRRPSASRPCSAGATAARALGSMPPLWRQATAREARDQRGHGRLRAGGVPGDRSPRSRRCSIPRFNLYGVQATTHPVAPLLVVNGPYGRADRLARWQRLLRPRLPRQRDDRARHPPHPAQRRWRLAGPLRHGHPGQPREVRVLHRGERGRPRRGAAARRRHGDRLRRRGPAQRQRSRLHHRQPHPRQRRRYRRLPRLQRGLVLLAGAAHGRPRARARRARSRTTASRARTCSASSTRTRGSRSG